MKKLSIFLVAVLLIASLFVSCDNTTKAITDEHVKVTFSVDSGSRGLGYTIEPIPDTDLQWYYTAVKSDPNDPFKFGEVPEDNPVEVTLGNEITFSQGLWDFTLFARRKDVESQPIVYSGASSDVLITRAENPVPIIVHVSPSTAGVNGTLTLNNVSINTYAGEGHVSSSVMANRAVIKNSEGTEIDTLNLSNGSYTGYVLPAGDYSVVVKYYNTNGNVENASEEIFITVWSGRTTTIRGNVDEITGTGTLNKYITEDTVNSTITSSSDSAEFVAKVAPVNSENSADGTTTVSFAANSLVQSETETDVSLKVSVKDIETAGNTFTVVGNNQSAVAGISLSLTVDGENKTGSFGDAVISTYIVKGLTSVNVKYNGTEYTNEPGVIEVINSTQTPEDNTKYYESDTGKLVFSTNHFSEYYVVSNPVVAINETTNTAYATLAAAIDAVVNNETIVLLKDVSLTSVLEIGKSIVIDGNGHNIFNTADRVIRITQPNLNVELYNLGVISKCTIGDDIRGISFDNISSNSSLLLDGCTVSASYYAISIVPEPSNLDITIKNGTVAAGWAAINSYSNNSTFTIENSTLRGLNDKGESSWNNFATIVFDGKGLTNAENIGKFGSNNNINIIRSTIYAVQETSNDQAWIKMQYGAQNNRIEFNDSRALDKDNKDLSQAISYMPFVNKVNGSQYEKSYDLHLIYKCNDIERVISYNGEFDDTYLVENGVHVPYGYKNAKNISRNSTQTYQSDTMYYLAPGEYGDFSAYLHGSENVGFTAKEGAKFNKVVIGYHAGQDLSEKQNSTLTIKGFKVDGELMVNSADQKVVIEGNTAALITLKTHQFDDMNIQVINNTLTGGSDKASQKYGIYIVPNKTNYDLNISGNTFSNIYDHAIAVQGNGDGSAVTAANSIIVKDNKFESYGLNGSNGRAAFKIWEDKKYAPSNGGEINSDASSLIQNIHDNNTFSSSLGTNCVLGNFYGILVQFNNQGTN